MSVLVMYHGKCPDGFTAAWAAWRKYPDAEFVEVTHTDMKNIPDVTDKEVYLLDFCFPPEVLLDLKGKAKSLIVLDHHQSAIENVEKWNEAHKKQAVDEGREVDPLLIIDFCIFDLKRSGAGLAWDYFHSKETRPWLINYIEYRDLGGIYHRTDHPFPHVEELLATVDSYEKTFDNWNKFADATAGDIDVYVIEGKAIRRYAKTLVNQIAEKAYDIKVDGKKVRCVNTPIFQSEVGNILAQRRDYSICWYQLPMKTKFSLRSSETGTDVCKVAQSYEGGGGHVRASGFSGPKIDLDAVLKAAKEGKEDY